SAFINQPDPAPTPTPAPAPAPDPGSTPHADALGSKNDPKTTEHPGEERQVEFGLAFTSLDSFVTEYIGQVLRRRLNRTTAIWCPEWWRHPEAIVRLGAMWRAFEYLRVDAALGMSTFWLHHADPHMRVLMDPEFGPFALCDPREGHAVRELEPLPMAPSPPEIWDHPAFRLDTSDLGQTGNTGGGNLPPPPAPSGYTLDIGPEF
ncbi:DUF4913 domain-containing protein, partial [Uniformispora flossi]